MRPIPETARNADWPRLVASSIKGIIRAVRSLQDATDYANLGDYANDAAAAAGGVAVGGRYRTGSTVKVRVS